MQLKANKLIIGITGGIGSGKTAATDQFAALGIEVIDADRLSREVVKPGSPALQAIAGHFGAGKILTEDGQLNRRALRQIIFTDHDAKKWLEQLLHPLIRQEIVLGLQNSQSPYTILASPLLLETDQQTLCSRILLIDAPEELQIRRTADRDQSDEASVRAIMQTQMPRHQRRSHADDIIVNDGTLEQLHQAVKDLHQTYLELAQ
ncbi:dephospho-CoA kinase [Pseudohongiella spirulinae]|uniref:Dephospho-CoA kinase n=1 Tax=Pseudohongiella spirulinae TaxID=1249552 RepID=A0A0S2KEZ9_9GAMM|nr:dephospho-CoA kinase [Pseudohongiella spirulinae]ALO46918.1 Dephospho-CoA kinase [Pseudohongiella spirulinae]